MGEVWKAKDTKLGREVAIKTLPQEFSQDADRLARFDGNGDGKLSLEEYHALWLDAIRARLVDRFQHLDEDGDAAVTREEFLKPYARLVAHMDQNGDGAIGFDDMRHRGREWCEPERDDD